MNDRRVTAIFAFAAAIAAATVGISHFAMPRAQLHFGTGVTDAFFESLAGDSAAFRVFGLWLAAFNWAARRALGSVLPWIGVLGAVLYEGAFLGSLLHRPILIDLSAGFGGVVVAPVWSVWVGILLWRAGDR